jgi:D-lactate dehydrogenase (cytochrome)
MKSLFTDYEPVKTLKPASAAEVQEIIRKANMDKTPLVPVSSGTNMQDTHLPSVKNAVAVDLSGLKGFYYDDLNRNVVVEPGVTFADIKKACAKTGLRSLTAIDVPETASILSTYLEMMPLYQWPKYHPWEMLTMEGYRADGERFATGQMAMKQDRPDKYSWGVSFAMVARLYCMAQGTLGIITKVAVSLKTDMAKAEVLFFECRSSKQAAAALKAFQSTEEPHEIFAVNKTYFSELLGGVDAKGMAAWTVVIVNRGADKAEIDMKRKDAQNIAKALGGKLSATIKGASSAPAKILAEIKAPTGAVLHRKNGCWTPVVTVATAKQIENLSGLIAKNAGQIMMPLQAGGCFYWQPDMRYRESAIAETRKSYVDVCSKMLKQGVLFPRPSALIADAVAKQYADSYSVVRSIKKAVDPKNIMNPGKLGL